MTKFLISGYSDDELGLFLVNVDVVSENFGSVRRSSAVEKNGT